MLEKYPAGNPIGFVGTVAGLNDCALTIKDCQPNDDVLVRVKYWEIIADNLKKAGWGLGWVSTVMRSR